MHFQYVCYIQHANTNARLQQTIGDLLDEQMEEEEEWEKKQPATNTHAHNACLYAQIVYSEVGLGRVVLGSFQYCSE